MRRLKAGALAAAIVCAAAGAPRAAQQASLHAFDAHTFAITVPDGYTLADEATPMPGYKTFGWATAPAADGTSGVIQVSLYDMRKMGAPPNFPLDDFARTMVASKAKAVTDWKAAESKVEAGGAPAWRIEWSGLVELAPARAALMRGVMILGIKDDLGFRLESQDVDARAARTVPEGERSLKSFVLTVKR